MLSICREGTLLIVTFSGASSTSPAPSPACLRFLISASSSARSRSGLTPNISVITHHINNLRWKHRVFSQGIPIYCWSDLFYDYLENHWSKWPREPHIQAELRADPARDWLQVCHQEHPSTSPWQGPLTKIGSGQFFTDELADFCRNIWNICPFLCCKVSSLYKSGKGQASW